MKDDGIRQSYALYFRRIGIGYEAVAAYEVNMTPEKWCALAAESHRKWACRYGEMRHIYFADHLIDIIEDLNVEAIANGLPELAQADQRQLPYGAFSFLPPRDEHDWSLRAGLFLPDHVLNPRPFAVTLERIAGRTNWTAYQARTFSVTYDA